MGAMSKLFSRRDRGKKNSHQGIDLKKKSKKKLEVFDMEYSPAFLRWGVKKML